MIIEGLLNLLSSLLGLLLTPIDIPSLPPEVATTLSAMYGYLADGLGIFAAFTHFSFLITLFGIVIVIDVAMLLYKFIRWVLQKIPMAGIE